MEGSGQPVSRRREPWVQGADHTMVFGSNGLIGAPLLMCLHRRYTARAAAAHAAACQEIGRTVDLGSPDQLHTMLAGGLGLPIDRDATTDRTVLRELAARYPTPLLTHLLNWHDAVHARETLIVALREAQAIRGLAVAQSSRDS